MLFPKLSSRSNFVRQAANLWQYKELLLLGYGSWTGNPSDTTPQQRLATQLQAFTAPVHLVDGIPIPLCCFSRAPRCRSFQGVANYGYCAAKKQTYYGFHGHLLISITGAITGFTLTPANGNERDAIWEIADSVTGLVIGDKGYLSTSVQQELLTQDILLETSVRSHMTDTRPPAFVKLLIRTRRLIETVIGQLVGRFSIEKVWARDLWHLTSRLNRQLLAHTVCLWLNRHAPEPLQFELLVSA
jgi:hypothetical protein